jgi:glycosyltransferase involved in cell wall biosynthesis
MSEKLVSPLRLTLCAIAKNERENLPRCLASVKPYVDEMIVVDTGSEDGTPEIAAEYGAKVRYFKWCDDFAAARNYAISQASGDWILVLDADEELVVTSEDFTEQLTSNSEVILYLLSLTDIGNKADLTPAWVPRLFRNLPEICYEGSYHEQIKYNSQAIGSERSAYLERVKILHYGYSKEKVLQKDLNRNITILERLREKDGLNLMLLYSLAGMYSNTQQLEKARDCYEEAFNKLLPNLMEGYPPEEFVFVPSLMFVLGVQCLQQEDYETLRLLCQRGLEWCPNYPPLNYLAGATVRALGFSLAAIAYFETCIQLGQDNSYYKGEPFEQSYMTTYPAFDIGCIYLEQERLQKALAAFELALSFDLNFRAAQEKIDEIEDYLASVQT